jgi:hypothetical protein
VKTFLCDNNRPCTVKYLTVLKKHITDKGKQKKKAYRNPAALQRFQWYPEKKHQDCNQYTQINSNVLYKKKRYEKKDIEDNFNLW